MMVSQPVPSEVHTQFGPLASTSARALPLLGHWTVVAMFNFMTLIAQHQGDLLAFVINHH